MQRWLGSVFYPFLSRISNSIVGSFLISSWWKQSLGITLMCQSLRKGENKQQSSSLKAEDRQLDYIYSLITGFISNHFSHILFPKSRFHESRLSPCTFLDILFREKKKSLQFVQNADQWLSFHIRIGFDLLRHLQMF